MPGDVGELPPGFPAGFGQGPAEREAILRLTGLQGITPRALRALAWREGSASGCVRAISEGRAGTDNDRAFLAGSDPLLVQERLVRVAARFVVPCDPEYWPSFIRLADPPIGLFVRGAPMGPGEVGVAIVGARHPSSIGREVTIDLARHLSLVGVSVVSGGAIGIDAAAHRGALDSGGRTVVVLGSGIDVLYPARNGRLFDQILRSGGTVLSEYPPGVPAEPRRFPARNRLVAALSRGVVVVEGREQSGTRITAEHAIDLGLDVFAVPGTVTSPLAATPLALIRDGAVMIRSAVDLLEDLGFDPSVMPAESPIALPDDERRVLDVLVAPMLPEIVARAAGMPTTLALAALIRLELRGIVRASGGRFERTLKAADVRAEAPPPTPTASAS